MADARKLKLLTWLLRLSAGGLLLAFAAVPLPVGWMKAGHAVLDVGPYPEGPMFEYLARSISMLYGMHGVLLLIVSFDLPRYRPLVTYVGWFGIVFGAVMLAADIAIGFPARWVAAEGPPVMAMGVAVLWLRGAIPREWRRD